MTVECVCRRVVLPTHARAPSSIQGCYKVTFSSSSFSSIFYVILILFSQIRKGGGERETDGAAAAAAAERVGVRGDSLE